MFVSRLSFHLSNDFKRLAFLFISITSPNHGSEKQVRGNAIGHQHTAFG